MDSEMVEFSPVSGNSFAKGVRFAKSVKATFNPATKTWTAPVARVMEFSYGRDLALQLRANYCKLATGTVRGTNELNTLADWQDFEAGRRVAL